MATVTRLTIRGADRGPISSGRSMDGATSSPVKPQTLPAIWVWCPAAYGMSSSGDTGPGENKGAFRAVLLGIADLYRHLAFLRDGPIYIVCTSQGYFR